MQRYAIQNISMDENTTIKPLTDSICLVVDEDEAIFTNIRYKNYCKKTLSSKYEICRISK